ncbi:MAG: TIGR02281 family clan AA aspartic protease [Gammaproteobacteria bacterium]|nr:TIGR02281 family clan AA aspartic protease [Gammaproteobacteria bacterium]
MWIVAWGCALLLLYLFFADRLEQQFNPNQKPESLVESGYVEVVLKRNRGGQYVTSGKINDRDVIFLVDTGASGISIPEQVAKPIGLRKGQAFQTLTANGIGTSYMTEVDKITIGSLEVGPLKAGINPNMPDNLVLLGMSVLKDLEFTQRGDTLILRQLK